MKRASLAVALLNVAAIDASRTNNEKAPRLIFVIVVTFDSKLENQDPKLEFSIMALLVLCHLRGSLDALIFCPSEGENLFVTQHNY